MLNSKSSLPDPRAKRTRKLLEEAFRSLLAEQPCDEISVGDVTRRAEVNRATFYAHFDNFRDFATEMLRDELQTALRAGISQGTPLNAETLVKFGAALFEFVDNFNRHCSRVDSDKELNIAKTFQETIQAFLMSWVTQDRYSMPHFPNSTPENAATALAWALYGGSVRWSHLAPQPPATQAAREIVALLVH